MERYKRVEAGFELLKTDKHIIGFELNYNNDEVYISLPFDGASMLRRESGRHLDNILLGLEYFKHENLKPWDIGFVIKEGCLVEKNCKLTEHL